MVVYLFGFFDYFSVLDKDRREIIMKFCKFRILQFSTLFFILVLSCSVHVFSGERKKSINTEELQKILSIAGVESEVISLNRDDGFNNGIFFESKEGVVIVLGFTENGFQKGKPFILSTLNGEIKSRLSNKGKLTIVDVDGIEDIIGEVMVLVECILNAVDQMVTDIDDCDFNNTGTTVNCILDAVGDGVDEIFQCL